MCVYIRICTTYSRHVPCFVSSRGLATFFIRWRHIREHLRIFMWGYVHVCIWESHAAKTNVKGFIYIREYVYMSACILIMAMLFLSSFVVWLFRDFRESVRSLSSRWTMHEGVSPPRARLCSLPVDITSRDAGRKRTNREQRGRSRGGEKKRRGSRRVTGDVEDAKTKRKETSLYIYA